MTKEQEMTLSAFSHALDCLQLVDGTLQLQQKLLYLMAEIEKEFEK